MLTYSKDIARNCQRKGNMLFATDESLQNTDGKDGKDIEYIHFYLILVPSL